MHALTVSMGSTLVIGTVQLQPAILASVVASSQLSTATTPGDIIAPLMRT